MSMTTKCREFESLMQRFSAEILALEGDEELGIEARFPGFVIHKEITSDIAIAENFFDRGDLGAAVYTAKRAVNRLVGCQRSFFRGVSNRFSKEVARLRVRGARESDLEFLLDIVEEISILLREERFDLTKAGELYRPAIEDIRLVDRTIDARRHRQAELAAQARKKAKEEGPLRVNLFAQLLNQSVAK